jgi:L-amino acid N-acyltransferase YncA
VPADFEAIAGIYAHWVNCSVATFELEPPDAEEVSRRFATVTGLGLPYLSAVSDDSDDAVLGYAYCAPWKSRPGYRHTVEDSVYVSPHAVGRGVGSGLLDGLMVACAHAGIRRMIAMVVDSDGQGSLALHRGRGFTDAGRLNSVGYKHGRWLDTILLQRDLSDISDGMPAMESAG